MSKVKAILNALGINDNRNVTLTFQAKRFNDYVGIVADVLGGDESIPKPEKKVTPEPKKKPTAKKSGKK